MIKERQSALCALLMYKLSTVALLRVLFISANLARQFAQNTSTIQTTITQTKYTRMLNNR